MGEIYTDLGRLDRGRRLVGVRSDTGEGLIILLPELREQSQQLPLTEPNTVIQVVDDTSIGSESGDK